MSADFISDPVELCRLLDLPIQLVETVEDYPLRVARSFVDRMKKGDPNDPLLLQVLPRKEETIPVAGFSCDPLGERLSEKRCGQHFDGQFPSVLQKYQGRALVLATGRCALNCRFCFRRHSTKSFENIDLDQDLETIRSNNQIQEVILSGGDPLMLEDSQIKRMFHYIDKIPHVKRIRIHSRIPIVFPERFSTELVELLNSFSPLYLVLHVNHPNEINQAVQAVLKKLVGPVVLSQTVLLKGINDNTETLFCLFDKLADLGIVPYYLHQLDKVHGAAHFEVDPEIGRNLVAQLRDRLPGYAVPTYVREVVAEKSKKII